MTGREGLALRAATPEDREAVAALLAAAYPAQLAGFYPPAILEAAMPALATPNARLLASGRYALAFEAGELVGGGGWSDEGPDGASAPGLAHIRHFAVRADRAGRGVGGALLARVEAEARAAGFREVEAAAMLNAEPFYRARGYAILERAVAPMGGAARFETLRMRRRLG